MNANSNESNDSLDSAATTRIVLEENGDNKCDSVFDDDDDDDAAASLPTAKRQKRDDELNSLPLTYARAHTFVRL